jgi:hypothetical protein
LRILEIIESTLDFSHKLKLPVGGIDNQVFAFVQHSSVLQRIWKMSFTFSEVVNVRAHLAIDPTFRVPRAATVVVPIDFVAGVGYFAAIPRVRSVKIDIFCSETSLQVGNRAGSTGADDTDLAFLFLQPRIFS